MSEDTYCYMCGRENLPLNDYDLCKDCEEATTQPEVDLPQTKQQTEETIPYD